MKKYKYFMATFLIVSAIFGSCKKDFLDKKPDKSLLVPTTLTDFQTLLDNSDAIMNNIPGLEQIASDDFYTTDNGWLGLTTPEEKNSYLWKPDILEGGHDSDWTTSYQQVFYANVVLDGLKGITEDGTNQHTYDAIKGSALFYRALAFYELAQLYCKPYQVGSTTQDLGIPIRLSSDVNDKVGRGNLQQTYLQIVADLATAQNLLPENVPFKTRPCKAAALGLLARVYQTMQDYNNSAQYATACLKLKNTLLDFNSFPTTANRSFPVALPNGNNPEIIFYTEMLGYGYNKSALTSVDSNLYKSYNASDLRRLLFFNDRGNGIRTFKGSYSGNSGLFGGLATDEIYLIRAECFARLGNANAAMDDLNSLLVTRYKSGTYVKTIFTDANDALTIVLTERRKELLNRGLRWTDLKRLNLENQFAISLSRLIGGQTYTLPPNDKRYLFPIPDNEISQSGIQQNDR